MQSTPFAFTIRTDLYTKIVLTAIAVLLGLLAVQPLLSPTPARAQTDSSNLYIEPGVTTIRKTDGSYLGDGKVVSRAAVSDFGAGEVVVVQVEVAVYRAAGGGWWVKGGG